MNIFNKLFRFLGKDVEYSKKAWFDSILTAWSIAFSIILGISIALSLEAHGLALIIALIAGGLIGCSFCIVYAERAKTNFKSIAVLTMVNCACFTFIVFNFWDYNDVEIFVLFFVLVFDTTIIFILFCVILFQTTTILERGRVTAGILASIAFAAPVVYLSLSIPPVKYLLIVSLILFITYLFIKKLHVEIFLSPRVSVKDMFNENIIRYSIISCGFGFIEGLFLDYRTVDPSGFSIIFSAFVLPAILFFSFILAGIILDLYGRRRALSLLLLFLGSYAFLSNIETIIPNINASSAVYLAALILNVIAILTIIGDISVAPAKILPILMVFNVGSIVGGYIVRNAFFSMHLVELPFILGSFGLIVIAIVLINTRDILSGEEQGWDKALFGIYVMHSSGVLLHHRQFKPMDDQLKESSALENQHGVVPDLISSGLVGITQLMQEIIQGQQIIRSIDNFSKKVLLEAGKYIIVALIVQNDLRVLREKLRKFIEDFEIEFNDVLAKESSYDMKKFESTKDLIKKYFDVKYLLGYGEKPDEGHSTKPVIGST